MADRPANPFAEKFARLIRLSGPVPLALFMGEANAAYYAAKDPLGAGGDFITAPEISQMFGEMIGIWLADVWSRAGRPPVAYVEAGPGRGTLAKDALRVMARFGLVPAVHFIETSPTLRALQAKAVPQAHFHDDAQSLPQDLPLLLVTNEFFDALPIRQWVKMPQGWRERLVGLGPDGALAPVAGDLPVDGVVPPAWRDAPPNTILETSPATAAVLGDLAARLAAQGGAGLVIDYGYATRPGSSTLQALRAHQSADPFADAGQADLTALVDFAEAAQVAQSAGAQTLPLATQGDFLRAMGIESRAAALAGNLAQTRPDQAPQIAQDLHRLTAPDAMGDLFKVLGLIGGGWPSGHWPAPHNS